MDTQFNTAWNQVTSTTNNKLKITDLLLLFDTLENLKSTTLISLEFREFLIEFILECPNTEITKDQFKSLMERLFECSIQDLLSGKLVGNENQSRLDDNDLTQTMNLESLKFNSFINNNSSSSIEKERYIRNKIKELENMISKSNNNKLKDVLINYYKKLDGVRSSLSISTSSSTSSPTPRFKNSKTIQRLKLNIDKQDILINELKKKVGDEIPTDLIGKIKYYCLRIYLVIWKVLRIPMFILIGIIIFNFLIFLIYDNENNNDNINSDDLYWDISV